VCLLILARDAGPNTTGRIEQVSRVTGIPLLSVDSRQKLGHWTGSREKVVAGLTDSGLAGQILSLAGLRNQNPVSNNVGGHGKYYGKKKTKRDLKTRSDPSTKKTDRRRRRGISRMPTRR
jgi:hypothetical protein